MELISPKFEHVAFPAALAFVSGFIDLFGFMAWYGLLVAHYSRWACRTPRCG
jgi:uncharacterized membrane protein YoaK (UPF0700 family)